MICLDSSQEPKKAAPAVVSASERRASRKEEEKINLTGERVIGNGSFGVVFQVFFVLSFRLFSFSLCFVQATVVETGEIVAVKKVLQDKRFKVA